MSAAATHRCTCGQTFVAAMSSADILAAIELQHFSSTGCRGSIGEVGALGPAARHIVHAVIDGATCPSCRRNDGAMVISPADGETVAIDYCEHVRDGTGVCRCLIIPAEVNT